MKKSLFTTVKIAAAAVLLFNIVSSASAQTIDEIKAMLKQEKRPRVEFKYNGNLTQIYIDGKSFSPLIYNTVYDWNFNDQEWLQQVKDMRAAGFRIFVIGEGTNVWKKDGSINCQRIENIILKSLQVVPDAYFILAMTAANPPKWWRQKYPNELIDYADGVDPQANEPLQRIDYPSMASDIFRRDLADFYARMIKYLEKSDVSKRIIAYRPDAGVYREWHYWGMRDGMPDVGRAMTGKLRKYLKKVYKNDVNALRKAWNDPKVTFETAAPPDKDAYMRTSAGMLRSPIKERQFIDFMRCMQLETIECLKICNAAAKKACANRVPIGNYSGYFFGMLFPSAGWHLANDQLLDSDLVDFQSSPATYGADSRSVGESQMARSLTESYPIRNKICILESDTRTHLTKPDGHVFSKSPSDTVALLTRDYAHMLTRNSAMWFLDFCKTWYRNPETLAMFKRFIEIRDRNIDNVSSAEVVIVADFESVMFHATRTYPDVELTRTNIEFLRRELTHAGVAFDVISIDDLHRPGVRDYKFYIFPNMFYVTPEKMQQISKLQKPGKTLFWYFAPGYLGPDGESVARMSKLTKMRITLESNDPTTMNYTTPGGRLVECEWKYKLAPVFSITDGAVEKLGTMKLNNKEIVTFARKKLPGSATNIFCTTGYLDRTAWQELLKKSGVHVYIDSTEPVIIASSSYVAVHTAKGGNFTVKLPKKAAKVTMLMPEEKVVARNVSDFKYTAPARSTAIFLCE